MIVEWIWISISTLLTAFLLWRFVPVEQIRKASISFFIMLVLTWFHGVIITEFLLSVSPVRLFPEATRMNFFEDFMIYPSICVLHNQLFPNKNRRNQLIYTLLFSVVITLWNYGMEKFTDLEQYIQWSAFNQFIITFITLWLSRSFVQWLFMKPFPSVENGG